jgi:hypothetical protein
MSAIARSVQRDVAMGESLDAPHFLDFFAAPLVAMTARRLEKVAQKRT